MFLVAPLIWIAMAQSPTAPLSGTVIGPNGEPVAGADLMLAGMPADDLPILARGRSDAQGRFSIERPAGLAGRNRFIGPTLWVVKRGFRLSFTRFAGPMPGADEPVRVVLGPPGKAEVRVEGSDEAPLVGARVRVERFGRESTNVPDEVVDLIEVTTDKDGLAVIDAAANDEVAYIDVHSNAFGIQGRWFSPTPKPKRLRLRPGSSLKGRLRADDPTMARGWRVFAYTQSGDPSSKDPETKGYAKGTTDDDGRFVFPVIAPGSLQLVLKPPREWPVLPDIPRSLAVLPGRANSMEIPLRPAATIAGVVRERGTGLPVPGVKLWLVGSGTGESHHAESDGQGQYVFRTLARKAQVIVTDAPTSHVRNGDSDRKEFAIPEAPGRIDLDPIEILRAAPPLRFLVRDESGRPVENAKITGQSASGIVVESSSGTGAFTVSGVAPNGEVTIEARRHERMTAEPVKAIAGGTNPAIVTIVPGQTLALAGRARAPSGSPIAGASVEVKFRLVAKGNGPSFVQLFRFDDNVEIRSGSDGAFRTPKELPRNAKDVRVEASADGFLSAQSEWIPTNGTDLITVPDLTLRRSRTLRLVSGRVLDRQGKGVAGASVFQSGDLLIRTMTTTDADGRFQLAGVSSGAALIFAEKAGFRFGGTIVKPGETRVDVRLARLDEPPRSMPKSLPSPLTRAEERAMAMELLRPRNDLARPGSGGPGLPTPLWLDPDRAMKMLEDRVYTNPAQVLLQIALGQLETDPVAAIATIEADFNPASRAEGYLAIADAMPESDRARRVDLIDRALAVARRVINNEAKLQLLGHIADGWLDLDAVDRAIPVIREGQSILATMPKDPYFSGVEEFADVLAVVDLASARSIIERKGRKNVSPTDPATIQRHLGEAAVRLAAINPAEAERLVPDIMPNLWAYDRDQYVFRICRRMSRADLPRARRILETIDRSTGPSSYPRPAQVPYGLGLMASERAATDPAGTRLLLDEAFARLRQVAGERDGKETNPSVSSVMAGLLPVVERLEPDHLEERLWLSAACRASLASQPELNAVHLRVGLASLVSRYDRDMAAVIIAPALERLPELLAEPTVVYNANTILIEDLATYDPRAVMTLIGTLPDSARRAPENNNVGNFPSIEVQFRSKTAEMLGLPIEKRRRKASVWSDQRCSVRRPH
jgi:hypothetical protein